MTEAFTEYGYEYLDADTRWPDSDGELFAASPNDYEYSYTNATTRRGEVDVERLRAYARSQGFALVSRTWNPSVPEKIPTPLPTATTSVVRATRQGKRGVAVNTGDGTGVPWLLSYPDGRFEWVAGAQLSDVEIILDEGAA